MKIGVERLLSHRNGRGRSFTPSVDEDGDHNFRVLVWGIGGVPGMERQIAFMISIGAILDFRIVGAELCRTGLARNSDPLPRGCCLTFQRGR